MPDDACALNLPAELQATLRAVAQAMQVARGPWWVIGSAAVALHGAGPATVADVDVLLMPDDAARVFARLGLAIERGAAHPDFRSDIFGTWRGSALPVEFMAGFCHRQAGEWIEIRPATRIAVQDVFVPEREELRVMIKAFGRPKDVERARLLSR